MLWGSMTEGSGEQAFSNPAASQLCPRTLLESMTQSPKELLRGRGSEHPIIGRGA